MKRCLDALPQGYAPALRLDLLNDRRQLTAVAGLNLAVALLMTAWAIATGHPLKLAGMGFGTLAARFAVFLCGTVAYMGLHELTHGVVIRLFGGRPYYGFRGGYAYTGCEGWFSRAAYLTIALSPVVLWGAVLALILPAVSEDWFWAVYLIQMVNLSGAAGDYYVTYRALRLPRSLLVRDTGIEMTFFTRGEKNG